MKRHDFKRKGQFFIISFLTGAIIFLTGFQYAKQLTAYIELTNNRLAITPAEFYIADVTDSRDDKTNMGQLVQVATANKPPALINVNVKGGVISINNFFTNSLPVNKSLRPVIISIKSLKITETPIAGGKVNGQILLLVSFSLQKADTVIHLVDYKGSAAYQRTTGLAQQIEPLLKSTLNNSLVYLNNWMNAQADHNIKLAKEVKIIFSYYNEPVESDTIYYNINRPLNWTDFKQKVQAGSKYGAEIFTSLGYNENVEVVKGVIYVRLALKVFVPKSACWVKYGAVDAYSLNHEQRHFDIVMLAAGHFMKALQIEKFDTDNYDGPINVAYFDALRELYKLQKLYDKETDHSIDKYNQQLWDSKIEKELKDLGIKPNHI